MIKVLQSKDTENKNEIWYKFQGESYDIKPVGEYPKNSGKYVANGSRFFENAFNGCTDLTTITINKAEGSITGAPWGATNAEIVWTG